MVKSLKEILADDFWIMPATPKYKDKGIPYITSKNIKNGAIDFRNVNYISEEDYESISKNRPIQKGDILISMIGTLGETAEVTEQDGKFYGQNMFLVRLNSEAVDKRYFLNYFQSSVVKRALAGSQNQSTQKYLKANHIEDLQIPLPSIEDQEKIAKRLDLLSQVIVQRKQQLDKFDELIKARFVELFGDPRINPLGYDTKELGKTCTVITGNTPSRKVPEYYGDYMEWIKTDNIVSGVLNPTEAAECLSESGVNEGRCVDKNAILMACIAGSIASIGRVCVTDRRVAFNQQINAIVPGEYNTLFLYILLQISKDYLVEDINMALKGILSKSKLEEKVFIVPPMELQNQFADFVKQVDKSKVVGESTYSKRLLWRTG